MWLMSKTVKFLLKLLCPRPLPLFLAIVLALLGCAFACEEDGWHPLKLLGPTHEQRFVESDCYSDRNQCMAYPGRAQINSYGLRFRLEYGEASCPDGYLICYESQLDGRSTQTGLVSENAYRINNVKRGNEVANECRAARKKHLKGKPTFLVPQWHGLRVKKENGSKEFNIELSYTNRTYKIEAEKEFTFQLGNRSHLLTQVMVYNEEDGTESPVNLEKNGTKFLSDVSRGGRMQRYAGLWSLAVDLLPLEIHNSIKLYVQRNSSECKLHAWLNHPTDDPGVKPMPPTTTTTEGPKYECKYEINAKAGENVTHYGIRLRDPDMPSDVSDWLLLEIDTESGISQIVTYNNGVERVHSITCFGKVASRAPPHIRNPRNTSAQFPLSQEEPSQEPSSQESTIEESPNQELENPPRDPKSQSPRRIHKCHEKGMLSFEQPLADQFPTLNNANVTFDLEVREFFVKISMTINESTQVRAYDFGYIWPNEWWNGLPAEKVFIVEQVGNLKIVSEPKCSTGKLLGANEAEYDEIQMHRMFKLKKELGDNSTIHFHARVQKPEKKGKVGGFMIALLNNAFEINKLIGEVAMALTVDVSVNKEELTELTQGKNTDWSVRPEGKLQLTFGQFFECKIVAKPPQSFVITFQHAGGIESLEVQSYLPFWAVTHISLFDNIVIWDSPIVDFVPPSDSFTRADLPDLMNYGDQFTVTLSPSNQTEAKVYLLHKMRKFDQEVMKIVGGAVPMRVDISRPDSKGTRAKLSATSMGLENLTFANRKGGDYKIDIDKTIEIGANISGFEILQPDSQAEPFLAFDYHLPRWTVNHIWIDGNFNSSQIVIKPIQNRPKGDGKLLPKFIRIQDSLLLKSRVLTFSGKVITNNQRETNIQFFFLHDALELDSKYGQTALHVNITSKEMALNNHLNGKWGNAEKWDLVEPVGDYFKMKIGISVHDGRFELFLEVKRQEVKYPCIYYPLLLPPWAIQHVHIMGNVESVETSVEEWTPKCADQ